MQDIFEREGQHFKLVLCQTPKLTELPDSTQNLEEYQGLDLYYLEQEENLN